MDESNVTCWVRSAHGQSKCVRGYMRGLSDDERRHSPAGSDLLAEVKTDEVPRLQGKSFKAVADADGRAYWVRAVGARASHACPEFSRVYLKSL